MYYTIYKTTNIINGKYYIGAHKTTNLSDTYFGSGNAIKNAIVKYGKENFHKEIIDLCESETKMYIREKEIITQKIVNDPKSYNMTIGGIGGFSHIDNFGDKNPMKNPQISKKVSIKQKQIRNGPNKKYYDGITRENQKKAVEKKIGSHLSEETKSKISRGNTGKKLSDETKRKIGNVHRGKIETTITRAKKSKAQKERIKRDNLDMGRFVRGTKFTDEHKEKIRQSKLGKKHKVVECPYCKKVGGINNMYRWHFENCKLKVNNE